jgi:predicted lipoprotein with Yx(FWY)xxD motif
MRLYLLTVTVAAALALLSSCGGSDNGTVSSTPATTPTASASGAKVALRATSLGRTLVDGAGRTLYLFEKDKGTTSSCTGACAAAWPPFTTSSRAAAGPGVGAGKIGTTKRPDGATQVTYGGHPLYFYAADRRPGDTRGQGLEQFGAEWYALGAGGSKIEGHEGRGGGRSHPEDNSSGGGSSGGGSSGGSSGGGSSGSGYSTY